MEIRGQNANILLQRNTFPFSRLILAIARWKDDYSSLRRCIEIRAAGKVPMVGRRDDKKPVPPGGRVAERLRLFLESRGSGSPQGASKTKNKHAGNEPPKTLREETNARQDRPKARAPEK
jgi:hypothetical protein